MNRIELDGIAVDVVRKNIKNLNLSVRPPSGDVRISAPVRMSEEIIREFADSKLDWIRRQQRRIRERPREDPRKYIDNENHRLWGRSYALKITEYQAKPMIVVAGDHLVLRVRPGADAAKKQAVLDAWYRDELMAELPALISQWEERMGVVVERFSVRRMKARWGSCTPTKRAIRLSMELARRSPECLEYVLVHEMVHLLEPSHNARFRGLMDQFMPDWRHRKEALNRFPLPAANSSR